MLEDIAEGVFDGLGWGIGAVALAAAVLVGSGRARPLAKGAIKAYLSATQGKRQSMANVSESLQDIYAEAKQEQEAVPQAQPASPAPTNPSRRRRIPVETPSQPG